MSNDHEVGADQAGTSRRDLLKLGGLAAAGGVALGAVGSAATAAAATPQVRSNALRASVVQKAGKFSVEINGVAVPGITQVTEVTSSDVAGSAGTPPSTAGHIQLARDWSNTPEWVVWRKAVIDGKVDRRSISVIFHNDAGEEAGRLSFTNCYPTGWTAPSLTARTSAHAVEKLDISFETFEFKKG